MSLCKNCSTGLNRLSSVYCSNKCQKNYEYATYIKKWKQGKVTGSRGVDAKNISRHIVRYLISKYEGRCVECGWNKLHPVTGNVLLEVDHIDGDSDNNQEENLQLLCPNCHSLTSTYKNLNNGMGREWRRSKYIKSS